MVMEERQVWQQLEGENAPQLRLSLWTRVRQLLDRAQTSYGRTQAECAQAAASHLRLLESWERYWLYPGAVTLMQLRRQLEIGRLDSAAEQARSIVRLLGEYGDRALLLLDGNAARDHYFTVLLVDAGGSARAEALQRTLTAWPAPEAPDAYRLLGVDTVEDALCAVSCNEAIEACIFGAPVPWRGRRKAPWLSPAIGAELDRLAESATPPMAWLGQRLAQSHPRLRVFSMQAPSHLHRQLLTTM